jgi:hypothetical protein
MQASADKARKLKRRTKHWFAGLNSFVRALDIGVFSEVARWLEMGDQVLDRKNFHRGRHS